MLITVYMSHVLRSQLGPPEEEKGICMMGLCFSLMGPFLFVRTLVFPVLCLMIKRKRNLTCDDKKGRNGLS